VILIRDVGSPGGLSLQLDLAPGLPRMLAAGRFLAPPGQYYPVLLPEGVPQSRLSEVALAEISRGARWVKLIADFPPMPKGTPTGPPQPTYSTQAISQMVAAVHAAGGRVAAHTTLGEVAELVRAGVDSIEHGTRIDEAALRLMAQTGAAWTPTLCTFLRLPANIPPDARQRAVEAQQRLREMLPLAHRLGIPILAGTDTAGTLAHEIALLAEYGLDPHAALSAATTTAYRYLDTQINHPHQPATLVTYDHDPRHDLAALTTPNAILIDGIRLR